MGCLTDAFVFFNAILSEFSLTTSALGHLGLRLGLFLSWGSKSLLQSNFILRGKHISFFYFLLFLFLDCHRLSNHRISQASSGLSQSFLTFPLSLPIIEAQFLMFFEFIVSKLAVTYFAFFHVCMKGFLLFSRGSKTFTRSCFC